VIKIEEEGFFGRELMGLFPDLSEPLQKLIVRLVDLHPIVKDHYYHPKMLGSRSIKGGVPALAHT
jgi:hypothetical protein